MQLTSELLYFERSQVLALARRAVVLVMMVKAEKGEVVLRVVGRVAVKVRNLTLLNGGVSVEAKTYAATSPRLQQDARLVGWWSRVPRHYCICRETFALTRRHSRSRSASRVQRLVGRHRGHSVDATHIALAESLIRGTPELIRTRFRNVEAVQCDVHESALV